MLSVSQLKTPPTRAEVTQWLIDTLQDYGFQTTGWQEGRIQHTLLQAFATVAVIFAQVINSLVRASFNSTSSGAALTLYSASRFDNTRAAAIATEGPFTFANTATVPYSVEVGALVVTNTAGVQFSNTAAATIPASSSGTTIAMKAVLAGAAGNIANNSALTLVTPLAGVSATNPSPGTDGDGNPLPWYSTATGADIQSDVALQQSNSTKWGLLAVEKTSTALKNLALKQTGVSKVTVRGDNPRGPGTVDIYLASDSAILGTSDMEAAQAAFADYTFQTDANWPPAITDGFTFPLAATQVYCRQPATQELNITGAVYYDPNYTEAEVKANLQTVLDDFVALTPIGGRDYSPGPSNVITLGDILQAMETTVGVRTVTLTAPTGNVAVGTNALVVAPADWFTGRLTFAAVTS